MGVAVADEDIVIALIDGLRLRKIAFDTKKTNLSMRAVNIMSSGKESRRKSFVQTVIWNSLMFVSIVESKYRPSCETSRFC